MIIKYDFLRKIQGTYFKISALYFKIYGLYFLQHALCFFPWLTFVVVFSIFGGLQPLCFLHICVNFVDGWERKSFEYDGNFLTLYVI